MAGRKSKGSLATEPGENPQAGAEAGSPRRRYCFGEPVCPWKGEPARTGYITAVALNILFCPVIATIYPPRTRF